MSKNTSISLGEHFDSFSSSAQLESGCYALTERGSSRRTSLCLEEEEAKLSTLSEDA